LALAIILDMDGLMLETEPISLRVWRQAAQELGYLLDDEMCDRMIGLSQSANREMLLRCLVMAARDSWISFGFWTSASFLELWQHPPPPISPRTNLVKLVFCSTST
jgi:beta-phosphoglucomutase-like phosphatase (HAD superfamily)